MINVNYCNFKMKAVVVFQGNHLPTLLQDEEETVRNVQFEIKYEKKRNE